MSDNFEKELEELEKVPEVNTVVNVAAIVFTTIVSCTYVGLAILVSLGAVW
jgi:hypothetical protein